MIYFYYLGLISSGMSQGQGPNSNSLLTGPHNGQGAGGNVGQNQGQGVAGNNQVCLKEYY